MSMKKSDVTVFEIGDDDDDVSAELAAAAANQKKGEPQKPSPAVPSQSKQTLTSPQSPTITIPSIVSQPLTLPVSKQPKHNSTIRPPAAEALGISTYMQNGNEDFENMGLDWDTEKPNKQSELKTSPAPTVVPEQASSKNVPSWFNPDKVQMQHLVPLQTVYPKQGDCQASKLIPFRQGQDARTKTPPKPTTPVSKQLDHKAPHQKETSQKQSAPKQSTGFEKKKHLKALKPSKVQEPSVVSFTLATNPLRATFMNSDNAYFEKTLTSKYLSYLEQYFSVFFNKLIPMHNPHILQSNSRAASYLTVYFNFLLESYPQLLNKFLRDKEDIQQTAPEDTISKFKDQVKGVFWQGYSLAAETVKKLRQEKTNESNRIERLQHALVLQLTMTEKMAALRKTITENCGVSIALSGYELGDHLKKIETLSRLDWLMGFQNTIEASDRKIAEHEKKGERVQADNLRRMLADFQEMQSRKANSSQLQQTLQTI